MATNYDSLPGYGTTQTKIANLQRGKRSAQSDRDWASFGKNLSGRTSVPDPRGGGPGMEIRGGRVVQTSASRPWWETEAEGGAVGYGMPLGVTPSRENISRPTAPTMPTFKAPTYDEGEVKSLARKHSAPQLTKLREAVQTATSASRFENPNVQRMTLRSALAGYGEGLGAVTGAADESARREYGQRYALEQQEALTNYQAQRAVVMQDWQNAWSQYNRALDMSTPRY